MPEEEDEDQLDQFGRPINGNGLGGNNYTNQFGGRGNNRNQQLMNTR